MRQLTLLSFFTFLLTLAAAWPWPEASDSTPNEAEKRVRIRQDSGSSSTDSGSSPSSVTVSSDSSTTDSSSPSSSTDTGSSDTSSGDSAAASSSTSDGSASGSQTSGKGSKTTEGSSHTSYDPRLPPGGISMVTPAVSLGAQFYKVGDWVTFAWNYTSLSSTPSAIDILATCTKNQATYTIALNRTVEPTQEVLWDTGAYQNSPGANPFLTETYTLIVYDAASSMSAVPQAGYLAPFDQWTFGMYLRQPYVDREEFHCPTCNAASSSMERQTITFIVGMGCITVATFTWFANSFGVF